MASEDGKTADPILRLEPVHLSVEPGGEVTAVVRVHNPSQVVEDYTFEVLGPAVDFAVVTPQQLKVGRGDGEIAHVTFRPPVSPDTPAGEVRFGVRCLSGVDSYHAAVAEGSLAIGATHTFDAALVPVRRRGRWRGRYVVRVENTGNTAATFDVLPRDEDELLSFAWAPQRLKLARGAVGRSYVTVRPRAPFLVGKPEKRSFGIDVESTATGDAAALRELSGDLQQRAVGPVRARGLAALVGVGMLVLGAAAFLLGRAQEAEIPSAPPDVTQVEQVVALTPVSLRVEWAANPTAESYEVQRLVVGSDPADGRIEQVSSADGGATALSVDGLQPATTYCFRVKAINALFDGPSSDVACGTTPEAPADPASPSTGGSGTEDPDNGEEGSPSPPTGDMAAFGDGPIVQFDQFLNVDTVLREQALALLGQLRADGVARADLHLTDGTAAEFQPGTLVVFEPGFATIDAAQARCDELLTDGVAETCRAVDPSTPPVP